MSKLNFYKSTLLLVTLLISGVIYAGCGGPCLHEIDKASCEGRAICNDDSSCVWTGSVCVTNDPP